MSERSRYLLCRTKAAAVAMVEAANAGALIVPRDGWTVVVVSDPAAVAASCKGPTLDYEYLADHGYALHLWTDGVRRARLEASSEGERRSTFEAEGWVEHGLCDAAGLEDVTDLLGGARWTHRIVRDRTCRTFGVVPETFLRGSDLEEQRGQLYERFPTALRYEGGKRIAWEPHDTAVASVRARAATTAKERARWAAAEKEGPVTGSPRLSFAAPLPKAFELAGDGEVAIGIENLGGRADGLSIRIEGGDGAVTLIGASADGRRAEAIDGEVRWPDLVLPAGVGAPQAKAVATVVLRLELRAHRAAEGMLIVRARSGSSTAMLGKRLAARPA